MARPRKKTLPLSELKSFNTLKSELRSMPELLNFDIEKAVLVLKQKAPDFKARQENVEKAIKRLTRFASENKEPQTLTRLQFGKILGISRPTLLKWIDERIIPSDVIPNFNYNKQTIILDKEAALIIKKKLELQLENKSDIIQQEDKN